jgi:beta-mannosidase
MQELSLNGKWSLRYCDPGEGEKAGWPKIGAAQKGFYVSQVPGDVHLDMVAAGVINEPLFGKNAEACKWMENKDWWYSTSFTVPNEFIEERVELDFEGLDTHADVWLNGFYLGHSMNALVPWIIDVTKIVRPGENLLVVRVDSGVRWARKQNPIKYYGTENVLTPGRIEDRENARMFLRRAQFSFGWDWAPRLLTTGIWRPVRLRSYKIAALRNVRLASYLKGKNAEIQVQIEVDNFTNEEQEATFHLRMIGEKTIDQKLQSTLVPGYNIITITLFIENPRLWWPNGWGEPYLYDFICDLMLEDEVIDSTKFKYGIREIRLLQEPIPEENGQSFTIVVNEKKIFCKGANWVPPDSIMARVSTEKYKALVNDAAEANFNMLRVWGGGIYEDEAFYDACDRAGIMVWQDFMFACSYVPDDQDAFVAEISKEAEFIIKRLSNHPCIVLWCGNNENQWIFSKTFILLPIKVKYPFHGWRIYHEVLPKLCAQLDPTRVYWPSSPYGGLDKNSQRLGDRHPYDINFMPRDKWHKEVFYKNIDTDQGKFISEVGCILGPSTITTIKRCLPEDQIYPGSSSWNFHENCGMRTQKSIIDSYDMKKLVGEIDRLPLEEYVILGQIYQAEAYSYILKHFRRRKHRTSGVLFWMFADCWGTTWSHTIVEYHLNRRPSFYAVKRAYAPVIVSFKEEENGLSIWLVNDKLLKVQGLLEYGWGTYDKDDLVMLDREQVVIPANVAQKQVDILFPDLSKEERRNRYYWVRFKEDNRVVSQDQYFLASWKDLNLAPVRLEYSLKNLDIGEYLLTIKANRFARTVQIEVGSEVMISDNYFDILPSKPYEIILRGPQEAVKSLRIKAINSED